MFSLKLVKNLRKIASKYCPIQKIEKLTSFKDADPNLFLLILDNIVDPQNLGQIIRTSECAGINGIVLPDRRSVKITTSVLQVSQGAFCNLDIIISKNIKYSINELKENDI